MTRSGSPMHAPRAQHDASRRAPLHLRRITGAAPDALLERIVRCEAVHPFVDRADLLRRMDASDRRCYGFFRSAQSDRPSAVVSIALTAGPSASIDALLAPARSVLGADEADTAVFYSISRCEAPAPGETIGRRLIEAASARIAREFPSVRAFTTLSPLPAFRDWVKAQAASSGKYERLARLDPSSAPPAGSHDDAELRAAAEAFLRSARREDGSPRDPVARFHLGNGARLDGVHPRANTSPEGLRQSFGVMARYRYERSTP